MVINDPCSYAGDVKNRSKEYLWETPCVTGRFANENLGGSLFVNRTGRKAVRSSKRRNVLSKKVTDSSRLYNRVLVLFFSFFFKSSFLTGSKMMKHESNSF